MKASEVQATEQHALENSIETIRARVDDLGVVEPTIQEYNLGSNQILVELPGVDDISRVREVIQSTARLEIHQVVGGPFPTEQAAIQSLNGTVPPEDEIMAYGGNEPDLQGQYYVLQRIAVVSGNDFRDAQPQVDENGRPDATFILTQQRRRPLLSVHQREYRQIAGGGSGQPGAGSGHHSAGHSRSGPHHRLEQGEGGEPLADAAHRRAAGFNPLPAGERYRAVAGRRLDPRGRAGFDHRHGGGADLHADLLSRRGHQCGSGLILNLVILLGFMGFSGAVLTLPGIAGVILTIGMGVDSNVLIFERIREELRAGKAPGAAVDQGFAHAWTTILDTHVTTIVSALILFLFGTGPVKGFAVTLSFGLAANLFTAVFVSRVIFDSILKRKQRGEALSIG